MGALLLELLVEEDAFLMHSENASEMHHQGVIRQQNMD